MIAAAAIAIAFVAGLRGQDEPPLPEGNAYIRSVLQGGPRSQDRAINDFTYDVLDTKEDLDKNGAVKSRETLGYEVYFVDFRPVRRLISRDGVPLPPGEQAAENAKAAAKARAIAEGRAVSEQPGFRLSRLVGGFDFVAVSRVQREGRKTLIFDFHPRAHPLPREPGDRTTDAVAKILAGRIQIDEADRRVVRLDAWNEPGEKASVRTGVKLGTFQLSMEYARIEEGVWLPRMVIRLVAGRAFIFKTFRIRHTTLYSNYRRFRIETDEHAAPIRE